MGPRRWSSSNAGLVFMRFGELSPSARVRDAPRSRGSFELSRGLAVVPVSGSLAHTPPPLRLARTCASRWNRASRSGSSAKASGRIFSATLAVEPGARCIPPRACDTLTPGATVPDCRPRAAHQERSPRYTASRPDTRVGRERAVPLRSVLFGSGVRVSRRRDGLRGRARWRVRADCGKGQRSEWCWEV